MMRYWFALLIAICCRKASGLASVGSSSTRVEIQIRDALYAELNPVSDLVMQSFYDDKKASERIWMHMYQLAELNRLQQNFPYSDQGRHRMLVAISKSSSEIIGFCDVDNRPASPNKHYKHNPRPILSDLLVSPDCRRKGIARELVDFCEATCKNEFKAQELYIRVLEDNEAAKIMYKTLGYEVWDNSGDPDEVILMKKDLSEPQG